MDNKQKLGRPRAQERESDGPVEEEILSVARQLFTAQGFSATSTRQIADAVGLRQPTLFHYFKNKAAIMEAIALRAVEPEIRFLANEAQQNHPPEVGLYRYVKFIVNNIQTNPNVIGSPLKFPELTREDFPAFWDYYDQLRGAMRDLIETGQKQKVFIKIDPTIAAVQLFALIESSLTNEQKSGSAVPEVAVTLVLRSLLVDADELEDVKHRAEAA